MNFKNGVLNILGLAGLLGVLVLLRYPIYVNWETFLNGDDAFMALDTIEMIRGNRFFLYHEGAGYIGILPDLAAIPFFWIMGINPLAYSAPGIVFYALFIGSSYGLVKKINPAAAGTTVFLLVFSPPVFLAFATRNMPHMILAFLGNLMFLQFIRVKESAENTSSAVLFLGFIIGLSIYNYTLSFIHVAVLLVVFALTFPNWDDLRGKVSFSLLARPFKNLKTKKEFLVRGLDLVVVGFIAAILFSLVWGGFGFKFAGVTLLQLNNLHKALLQLLVLIGLRFALDRHSLRAHCRRAWDEVRRIKKNSLIRAGLFGFLAGISPRLISILSGETKKGGQGFHVEFNPVPIVQKAGTLFSETLPNTFGVWDLDDWKIFFNTFSMNPENLSGLIQIILNATVTGLVLCACYWFFSSKWEDIKRILTLKGLPYSPALLILLYPLVLVVLSMLSQGPPASRYFIVLHGMVVIWIALYLDKVRKRSLAVFIALLLAWPGFQLFNAYEYYTSQSVMNGFKTVKKHQPLMDVIEFCKSNNIKTAYAGYWVAYKTTFLSAGSLTIAEYFHEKEVRGKIVKAKTLSDPEFAVITRRKDMTDVYYKYLAGKNIGYEEKKIGIYTILWNFSGANSDIDRLRRLI